MENLSTELDRLSRSAKITAYMEIEVLILRARLGHAHDSTVAIALQGIGDVVNQMRETLERLAKEEGTAQ